MAGIVGEPALRRYPNLRALHAEPPTSLIAVQTPTPDRDSHIDVDAGSRLQPGVDADALERLLQCFPPESRASHLEMFSVRRFFVDRDGRAPDVRVLTRISNPSMQNLLEEVWQPYWDTLSDAELADAFGGPPGLELARRRRAEERRG